MDPFAGSASTCVAAYQCGCKFYGIEREQEFYQRALDNLALALAVPPDTGMQGENAYEAAANLEEGVGNGDDRPHPGEGN